MTQYMRIGEQTGRTLWLVNGTDPANDTLIGMVDTKDLAEQIANAWNTQEDIKGTLSSLMAKTQSDIQLVTKWRNDASS